LITTHDYSTQHRIKNSVVFEPVVTLQKILNRKEKRRKFYIYFLLSIV